MPPSSAEPTIGDISMIGYLMFPKYKGAGFDFAVSHLSIAAWLDRISALPGWRPPYDLLRERSCGATSVTDIYSRAIFMRKNAQA